MPEALPPQPSPGAVEGVLIAFCCKSMTMPNYVTRFTGLRADAALASDDHFFDALAKARHVSVELPRRKDRDSVGQRARLQLATRCGGDNAASQHRLRPAAFLGSVADTLPTLALIPRFEPLIANPQLRRNSHLPYLRDAAAAWQYIADVRDADSLSNLHRVRKDDAHKRLSARSVGTMSPRWWRRTSSRRWPTTAAERRRPESTLRRGWVKHRSTSSATPSALCCILPIALLPTVLGQELCDKVVELHFEALHKMRRSRRASLAGPLAR
jgi:hypothetical protein